MWNSFGQRRHFVLLTLAWNVWTLLEIVLGEEFFALALWDFCSIEFLISETDSKVRYLLVRKLSSSDHFGMDVLSLKVCSHKVKVESVNSWDKGTQK